MGRNRQRRGRHAPAQPAAASASVFASAPPQWTELANTLVLAAAGCANACRPQRWRFSPITSRRTVHGHPARHRYGASTPRLKTGAAGRGGGVLVCRWVVALARVRGRASAAFERDAESALSPFGGEVVRPKASLCCCESWQGRGCASGFMAATVQRKQFPLCCADSSRDKFFSPLQRLRQCVFRCQPRISPKSKMTADCAL